MDPSTSAVLLILVAVFAAGLIWPPKPDPVIPTELDILVARIVAEIDGGDWAVHWHGTGFGAIDVYGSPYIMRAWPKVNVRFRWNPTADWGYVYVYIPKNSGVHCALTGDQNRALMDVLIRAYRRVETPNHPDVAHLQRPRQSEASEQWEIHRFDLDYDPILSTVQTRVLDRLRSRAKVLDEQTQIRPNVDQPAIDSSALPQHEPDAGPGA